MNAATKVREVWGHKSQAPMSAGFAQTASPVQGASTALKYRVQYDRGCLRADGGSQIRSLGREAEDAIYARTGRASTLPTLEQSSREPGNRLACALCSRASRCAEDPGMPVLRWAFPWNNRIFVGELIRCRCEMRPPANPYHRPKRISWCPPAEHSSCSPGTSALSNTRCGRTGRSAVTRNPTRSHCTWCTSGPHTAWLLDTHNLNFLFAGLLFSAPKNENLPATTTTRWIFCEKQKYASRLVSHVSPLLLHDFGDTDDSGAHALKHACVGLAAALLLAILALFWVTLAWKYSDKSTKEHPDGQEPAGSGDGRIKQGKEEGVSEGTDSNNRSPGYEAPEIKKNVSQLSLGSFRSLDNIETAPKW